MQLYSLTDVAGNDIAHEEGQAEVALWACPGIDARGQRDERGGYYLEFSEWNSTDINSTAMREELLKTCPLDEKALNKLSTGDLLKLVAPFLEGGWCPRTNSAE